MIKLERIHLLSRADLLQPLRHIVKQVMEEQGSTDESSDNVVLAINEACMNVIQHAYKGKDDGEIVVEFWGDGEELLVRLIDYAEKVDLLSIKSRDLDDVKPGGLGVHLINQVMDSVKYLNLQEPSGNVLEMRKRFTQ